MRVILDRNRGGSYLVMLIAGAGIYSMVYFVTYFEQQVMHLSPIKTGLSFLPLSLIMVTASQAMTRLVPRYGAKPLVTTGTTLLAAGLFSCTPDRRRLGLLGLHFPRPRPCRPGRRVHLRTHDHHRSDRRPRHRRRDRISHAERRPASRRLHRPGRPGHRGRHRRPLRGQQQPRRAAPQGPRRTATRQRDSARQFPPRQQRPAQRSAVASGSSASSVA